ncbi:MAG: cation transporter [Clostridia bacterium]|nr:cation transporter [Clostridia bacterium]
MLTYLIKRFAPAGDPKDPAYRLACGTVAAALGIALNALLFAFKLAAGLVSGSIAVTADAFNSLSDASSSLVALIGFRLAGKKPDPHHPFGHGRLEYVAGLFVAMLVVLVGGELLRSSVGQIVSPQPTGLTPLTAVILVASAGVKLYMCLYNRALGRRVDSPVMRAAAADSLGDMLSTAAVLAALAAASLTGRHIDGWAGLGVSLFILYSGLSAAAETISPLLGEAPSPELVEKITRDVMAGGHVLGVHDLVVHDYGPGRRMVVLHAEVPAGGDFPTMHNEIDRIERKLSEELRCEAVIHMDPVATDDKRVAPLMEAMTARLREGVDPRITLHDFHVLDRGGRTYLLFDLVAPYDLALSDEALVQAAGYAAKGLDGRYEAIVKIDKG